MKYGFFSRILGDVINLIPEDYSDAEENLDIIIDRDPDDLLDDDD